MNIDLIQDPQVLLEQDPVVTRPPRDVGWGAAAFVGVWELQSHIASFALIALLAFTSAWIALLTMLVWSLVATIVFFAAREVGYPNVLNSPALKGASPRNLVWYAGQYVVRAFLAGFQAFVFTRCSSFLLTTREECGRVRRAVKYGVLGLGLTLFGVTTAEHMLRTAGYSGARLRRLGLIGPFLNVPYRLVLSAAIIAVVRDSLTFV